jgi:hypothetical protein
MADYDPIAERVKARRKPKVAKPTPAKPEPKSAPKPAAKSAPKPKPAVPKTPKPKVPEVLADLFTPAPEAPKTPETPKAEPTPKPAPAPARTPASVPAKSEPRGGLRSKLGSLRRGAGVVARKPGMMALAALLAGAGVAKAVRRPDDRSDLEEAVSVAMRRAKGEQVARLLEQSRMERAITQNQARLAQANPTLYTSVMAGRKVPTGAVVLGGRPRTDLMRELAASMDSGAFQKKDPLSELLMG